MSESLRLVLFPKAFWRLDKAILSFSACYSSVIEFTSADYRKKRRFVTTNMTSYEGLPCATVSNAGILAENYKIKCSERAK